MNTIKIIFLSAKLGNGGAERVYLTLLKHLDRNVFQPKLLLLDKSNNAELTQEDHLRDLPNDVEVFDYTTHRSWMAMLWTLIRFINNERPHIILSNTIAMNFLLLLASFFISKSIKVAIKIGNVTSLVIKRSIKYRLASLFMKISGYRRCNAVISVSQTVANDFFSCFPIPKDKSFIIHNPVDVDQIEQSSHQTKALYRAGAYKILAIGRLHPVKNFALLLRVIAQLEMENVHLNLLGRGSEESALKALAVQLNISHSVTFSGFQSNPYPYMKQADLLILTSQYEGMPNVILEANACGTPVVAFNCPGAVGEMIEDGLNGFLVENQNQQAMITAIKQAAAKKWNKEKIRKMISSRYHVKHIVKQYEHVLQTM